MLTFGLILGTRMLLIPPSFTLIFRHRFDKVCGDVLFTFFACTHCVAIPKTVSPTLFTSAETDKDACYMSATMTTATVQVFFCDTLQRLLTSIYEAHYTLITAATYVWVHDNIFRNNSTVNLS